MPNRKPYLAASAATAITTGSYNAVAIGANTGVETNATACSSESRLLLLDFAVTGITTTTQLVVYLSWDSAGARPFTDVLTIDLLPGTGATQGAAARVDLTVKWPSDASPGVFYAQVDTDAGNVTVTARCTWQAPLAE